MNRFMLIMLTHHQVQSGDNHPRSVLKTVDDPASKAQRIASSWIVTNMLPIGQKTAEGPERECNQILLSEGDFVDVGVSFDIVMKKHRVAVHLVVEYVSQLIRAKDVAKVRTLHGFVRSTFH